MYSLGLSRASSALIGIALTSLALSGIAHADSDERTVISNPTSYPWYTICKVKIGPAGGGRGSGVLVAPCTILTNGHVVYNRSLDHFRAVESVHPGSYYDEGLAKSVDPYGNKPDYIRATNTKYVDTGNAKYDYGAIITSTSFEDMGLNTYMPVCFEYSASYVNVAGYPTKSLPSNRVGATKEMWWGHGDVKSNLARLVKYEATSTGGASGGGVWVYNGNDGSRKLVAVNQGHTNSDKDGRGVRFVDQNEDVIRDWMAEDCSQGAAFDGQMPLRDLILLRKTLRGKPFEVYPKNHFGLVKAPRRLFDYEPTMKVMQWIEGEFYVWEEYHLDAMGSIEGKSDGAKHGPRVIRLLEPQDAVMKPEHAAIFLSASMLWMSPEVASEPVIYDEPEPEFTLLAPDAFDEEDEQIPEDIIQSSPEGS